MKKSTAWGIIAAILAIGFATIGCAQWVFGVATGIFCTLYWLDK